MNRLTKAEQLKQLEALLTQNTFQSNLAEKLKKLAQPKTTEQVLEETGQENPYLGGIAMTESSDGKNLNHDTMSKGMHKGQTAGGMFGMMPNTALETLKLNPELARQYPELTKDLAPEAFTDRFNTDPEAAADFAKANYERNKAKTGSDEGAVYAQYNGLTGALRAKARGTLEQSPYLKKVKSLTIEKPAPVEIASMDLEQLLRGK